MASARGRDSLHARTDPRRHQRPPDSHPRARHRVGTCMRGFAPRCFRASGCLCAWGYCERRRRIPTSPRFLPSERGRLSGYLEGYPDEPAEPIVVPIVEENERWLAADKPHGMATMPRGSHVAQTLTVVLRRQFTNDELVAAHRLDAPTAGVVLVTKARQWRGTYQKLFSSSGWFGKGVLGRGERRRNESERARGIR